MGDLPYALKHRLTIDAYYRMGQAGVFAPDARVELIEGEVVNMPPIGSAHAGTVNTLNWLLTSALGERTVVAVQNPVRLGDDSELEPDVAVLRPRPDRYRDSHPSPADVLLIVEIADTSLQFDRSTKIPLYARHGIPEAWLVDLVNRLVSIYREPKDGIYRNVQTTGTPGTVELSQLPGVTIDLSGLL